MLESGSLKIIIILALVIVFIITWLILTIRNINFKKRIENYVISNNQNEDISILGKIENIYFKIRNRLFKYLKKTNKKEKTEDTNENLLFMCDKLLVCVFSILLYLIYSIISFTKPELLFIACFGLVGYLIPIIKKKLEYTIYRKKIEKDLLKVISLINSSLQSGKSIMQAIRVVTKELDGPLAIEFQKIEKDLEKGLSLSTAFTRFEKRVDLEDVRYITVSLLILNKTGGNIVSVFKSLEDRFYTRKKLENELNSIISSSKLVFQILVSLPFFLYLLIGLWNPTYFTIFFKSNLGIMLFLIILLIYLLYIVVIRRIMKVEKY